MAITYIEKGSWLHSYIQEQGHWLANKDGVWVSDDDVAVQAIIDAFDPLPYAKADKIDELKIEGARRASQFYSFLGIDPKRVVSFYNFAEDLYLSMVPAARGDLTDRLQGFRTVYVAAVAAIADINAMTDWTEVIAYDVVNTPTWP